MMNGCFLFHLVGVLLSISTPCLAARILGIFPSISRSHSIVYQSLTRELASRGHNVTVISAYPLAEAHHNYRDIAVPTSLFGLDDVIRRINGIQHYHGSVESIQFLATLSIKVCNYYLENELVQELMHSTNIEFDLIIYEVVVSECFLGFAHKFNKALLIGIYAQGGDHSILDIVGNPSPYAYIPDIHIIFTDHMTFIERLKNAITIECILFIKKILQLPTQDWLMRKYFNASTSPPYISDIQSKTSLLMFNTDVTLIFPRPYLPNVIEIGGIHIKPPKKLPQSLQIFLDSAPHGVVYFSLGTSLGAFSMSKEHRNIFINVFTKIKQNVLWKYNDTEMPKLSSNIRIEKWVPQMDVIAHPNVRVFITQGGMLSYQEAAHFGKPMLVIPIDADQFMNAQRIEKLEIGIKLLLNNLTSESLRWALDTLLNESRYRENAQLVSARFRDQLRTPLERAVFWTEYVIRHDGAPHLQSAARHLTWYQYFMIDVIVISMLVVFVVLLLISFIVKRARRVLQGGYMLDSVRS